MAELSRRVPVALMGNHPRPLEEKLLDVAADKSADLPRSRRQSPVNGALGRDAAKRQLDATPSESDPLPAKRARLTPTDRQRLGVDEETEQAAKTTLQQPKPHPPKRPYASFLDDFVDPVHPHPRPESLCAVVSEWLESVGSDREKRCRSDSHLYRSNGDDPVSRQLARSAPEMSYTRDVEGFVVPPTPPSIGSRARRSSTGDYYTRLSAAGASGNTASSSGVRNRMYRQTNLAYNGIRVRHPDAPLPSAVSGCFNDTSRAERNSPELSAEEMNRTMHRLGALTADGCDEDEVAAFLNDTVFPDPKNDPVYGPATGLMSSSLALMSRHLVPTHPVCQYRVTQPKPDKLYGYSGNEDAAFSIPQLLTQDSLLPRIGDYSAATSSGLRFPFFAIEFKAAGGTRGDLWVATNQCAGASSACLNAIDQLNTLIRQYQSANRVGKQAANEQRVDNLSYCIAVDNNCAHLYISWKEDDLKYYLQQVDAFLLSSPEHFKNFRKQVRNILDWGKDRRLKQIKDALDIILEEDRKQASILAKTRQSPSDGSAASCKKHKPSLSSRSSTKRGQGGEADESCWVSHDAHEGLSPRQQSLVNADYTRQAGRGPAFPEYPYPQAPGSFNSTTEPQQSFASDFNPYSYEAPSGHPRHLHGHPSTTWPHNGS